MAGRFRFSLEVVRRIRKQQRDRQRRSVAEAHRAVLAGEEQIAWLTRKLRDMVEQTREARRRDSIDLPALRENQFYQGWLHGRILDWQEELGKRRDELNRRRALLADASKQWKVIEKLREKQWNRYLRRIRKEEQLAGDEAALQTHLRKQRMASQAAKGMV